MTGARKKAEANPEKERKAPAWKAWLLYAIGILIFVMCMPPGPSPLAVFVVLSPWIAALAMRRRGCAVLEFWAAGFVLSIVNVRWLRYVTWPGWILLAFYLSLYFLVFALLLQRFQRSRVPLVVFVPIVWVALEYLRSFVITGFPWFYLGHAVYVIQHLTQIADVTGVFGVSFLVAAWNGWLADVLLHLGGVRRLSRQSLATGGVGVVLLTILVVGYGQWRLMQTPSVTSDGPRVCLVQGNIPQDLKMDDSSMDVVLDAYMRLSKRAVGRKFDLMIWPETMFTAPVAFAFNPVLREMIPEYGRIAEKYLRELHELAQRLHAPILIGAEFDTLGRQFVKRYNSAILLDGATPFGPGLLLDRYDKIHLVPFGEYTPLRDVFPFLARMVPYETGFSAGKDFHIFRIGKWRFGATICFEDTIPYLSRRLVLRGAQFLVNISNDGWFRASAELDQHLAFSTFRCIENRVPMACAANTGVSAIVTSTGLVQNVLNVNGAWRGVEGILIGKLMLDKRQTFYMARGDLFAKLILAAAMLLVLISFWPRRKGR